MKYEMIFGDAGLFDGAPESATHAVKGGGFYSVKNKFVSYVSSGIFNGSNVEALGGYLIAERRIIKEPKLWTWEDKKAGVLPDVGSIFTYRDETLTCHFIDGDGEIWAHDIDNNIVTPLLRDCQPIETPEEKVQREQEEFVASFNSEKYSNQTLYREGLRDAYRKLKGGE